MKRSSFSYSSPLQSACNSSVSVSINGRSQVNFGNYCMLDSTMCFGPTLSSSYTSIYKNIEKIMYIIRTKDTTVFLKVVSNAAYFK